MSKVLTPQQAKDYLNDLAGWQLGDDQKSIYSEHKTKNFVSAVEFINKVRDLAESADHHPDIHLTGYRNLKIVLSTHSAGGLTEKDFALAQKINELPIKLKK